MWVVLDDEVLGASADASPETTPETTPEAARRVNGASADAAEMLQVRLLEERVRAQDELIVMYNTQNSDWEQRYYGLREELAAAHRIAEKPQQDPAGRGANPGPSPVDVLEAGPLSEARPTSVSSVFVTTATAQGHLSRAGLQVKASQRSTAQATHHPD